MKNINISNEKYRLNFELKSPVTIIHGGLGTGKSLALDFIEDKFKNAYSFNSNERSCLFYIDSEISTNNLLLAIKTFNNLSTGYTLRINATTGNLSLKGSGVFNKEILCTQASSQTLLLLGMIFFICNLPKDASIVLIDNIQQNLPLDIQEELLETFTSILPNCNFIVTTNSPAIVMNGYLDCLIDSKDIWSKI